MNGLLAKIAGWAQFGLQLLSGVQQGGLPHGWAGWLTFAGSLAAAVGIHAASNVGQVSTTATATTAPVGNGTHVTQ